MFKNPGRQIMVLAIVFFCLGCVVTLFGAALIGVGGIVDIINSLDYGVVSPIQLVSQVVIYILAIVAELLIGIVGSWLSCLFLYSYGRLVDSSERTAEAGAQMYDKLESVYPESRPRNPTLRRKAAPQPEYEDPFA